ncbi:MAG: class I SAM-dependent methyltransferase [Candidatus Bathycorpusculaceae bacterium]
MAERNRNMEHYFAVHPKSERRLGIIRANLRGKPFEFLTASSVFSRKRVDLGTRLLIESMILPQRGYVLDVGCGYGAVGIAAASLNSNLRVIMVDVNTRAVRLAEQNIELNHLDNAEARCGHLYEPVEELTFNCILSNPPVTAGIETVKAIITEAPKLMADEASLQMVVKSKVGGRRLQLIFKETFGNVEILSRRSGYRVLMAEKH